MRSPKRVLQNGRNNISAADPLGTPPEKWVRADDVICRWHQCMFIHDWGLNSHTVFALSRVTYVDAMDSHSTSKGGLLIRLLIRLPIRPSGRAMAPQVEWEH